MGTLTSCLKEYGKPLTNDQRKELIALAKANQGEGYKPLEASINAVQFAVDRADNELTDIESQIEKQMKGKGEKVEKAVEPIAEGKKKKNRYKPDHTKDTLLQYAAKLGGFNYDDVHTQWGATISDALKNKRINMKIWGKPLFRKKGGLSIDRMGELLAEAGYLKTDINDKAILGDLFDKMQQSIGGENVFSADNQDALGYNNEADIQEQEYEYYKEQELRNEGNIDPETISEYEDSLKESIQGEVNEEILADGILTKEELTEITDELGTEEFQLKQEKAPKKKKRKPQQEKLFKVQSETDFTEGTEGKKIEGEDFEFKQEDKRQKGLFERTLKEATENLGKNLKTLAVEPLKGNKGLFAGGNAVLFKLATDRGETFEGKYDKKVRFEIDDSKAKLKEGVFETVEAFENVVGIKFPETKRTNDANLYSVLKYPEFFENYPTARTIPTSIIIEKGKDLRGSLSEDGIKVVAPTVAEARKALLHEIQHAIQEKEGFARGGSPEQFEMTPSLAKSWEDSLNEHSDALEIKKLMRTKKLSVAEARKLYEEQQGRKSFGSAAGIARDFTENDIRGQVNKSSRMVDEIIEGKVTSVEKYQYLAGEIESRDVSARADLTPAQRKAIKPYTSENISEEDAIVLFREIGEDLSTISRSIYDKGATDLKSFRTKLRDAVGDAWNKIRHLVKQLFRSVEDWYVGRSFYSPLSNKKGMVRVKHISPHKVEKFATDKIGTGQGAQSFGWGLYFYTADEVGDYYTNFFERRQENEEPYTSKILIDGKDVTDTLDHDLGFIDYLNGWGKDKKKQLKVIADQKEIYLSKNDPLYKDRIDGLDKLSDALKNDTLELKYDYLQGPFEYSATLHKGKDPSEYDYIRWDEKVPQATGYKLKLKEAKGIDVFEDTWAGEKLKNVSAGMEGVTGEEFYQALSSQLGSDKEASLFLLRAGIDGIKYPSGTLSGIKDSDKFNYVVFDENAITIDEAVDAATGRVLDFFKKATKPLDEKGSTPIFNDLVTVSTDIFKGGKTNLKAFRAELNKRFKPIWQKIRHLTKQLWEEAKAANRRLGERGMADVTGKGIPEKKPDSLSLDLDKIIAEVKAEKVKGDKPLSNPEVDEKLADPKVWTDEAEKIALKDDNVWDRLKDQWIGNRDWEDLRASVSAQNLQDKIQESAKDSKTDWKDIDRAIHVYIDTKNYPEHLDEHYDSLTDEQKKIVDLSQNLTDEQKAIADEIDSIYQRLGKLGKSEEGFEVLRSTLDNYVARVWDMESAPTGKGKAQKNKSFEFVRKFGTTTRHAKRRSFGSILEGWGLGYKLKKEGASGNLSQYMVELMRTIENKKLIKEGMKTELPTGDKLFTTKTGLPDYEEITHPSFYEWGYGGKVKGDVEGVDSRDRDVFITEDGTILKKKRIYAPKDIAKNLNRILGKSALTDVPGIADITKANAIVKAWILQSSLFHHLAFTRSFTFGGAISPKDANVVASYKKGLRAIKALDPDVELLVRNGLTIGRIQDWEENLIRQKTFVGKIMDKNKVSKAVADKVNRFQEWQTTALFNKFGAGLKAYAGILEYKRLLKEHPGMQPNEAAKMAANLINDDFGGLHLQRMGRNPTLQHIFRLFALAPDWTESNVRSMVKAIGAGKKEERKLYRKFWGRIVLRGMGLTTVLNLLLAAFDEDKDETGKDMDYLDRVEMRYKKAWEKGHLRWLDADITPIYRALGGDKDKRSYFSVVGHFRDPIKFVAYPITSAHHKGSVVYRIFHEAMTGGDWRGRRFTDWDELVGLDDEIKKRGELTKFTVGESGPIDYKQIPAYTLNQLRQSQPIQVQNALSYLSGEMDGMMALGKSMGFHMTVTREIDIEKQQFDETKARINKTLNIIKDLPDAEKKKQVIRLWDTKKKFDWAEYVLKKHKRKIVEIKKEITRTKSSSTLSDARKEEDVEALNKKLAQEYRDFNKEFKENKSVPYRPRRELKEQKERKEQKESRW